MGCLPFTRQRRTAMASQHRRPDLHGVEVVTMFHAQDWAPGEGYAHWRIVSLDSNDQERDMIDCLYEWQSVWYIGSPRAIDQSDPDLCWLTVLQDWAEGLHDGGYVGSWASSLMGGRRAKKSIRKVQAHCRMATEAAGRRNPYSLNWLMDHDLYNFFTPRPPRTWLPARPRDI